MNNTLRKIHIARSLQHKVAAYKEYATFHGIVRVAEAVFGCQGLQPGMPV